MHGDGGRAFDTVVVGLGAVGAACLLQLAQRGRRVLGLDRHAPPHAWGSSHGDTRITRCAVGEGEAYVPLVLRSHEIWREIERETGAELLTQCGALVLAGGAGTGTIHGKADFFGRTVAAAARFGIVHEVLGAAEIARRFPQFRLRGDEAGYHEPAGGYVRPERCVEAQLSLAMRRGAAVRSHTPVARIERDGAGVGVVLRGGERVLAGEVVLAAGAWAPGLVGGALAPRMTVTRQVLHWFPPTDAAAFAPGRFPVFIWLHGGGVDDAFYGFPIPPGTRGVKVASEQCAATTADPDRLAREVDPCEAGAMFRDHVGGRLPGLLPAPLRAAVCQYTVTPDGDFLVQRVPENDRILLVSACSGHGFKHSAGLGEAVARTLTGECDAAALAAFGAGRFGPAPAAAAAP